MIDEALLLRAYAENGDEAAFSELVQRHVGIVYHAALRQIGNSSLAEEVTQVVFTRLARKAQTLGSHSNLIGWLHTTAHFAAKETARTEFRRRKREHEGHLMQELLAQAPASPDWHQLRPVIDEALSELSEADRTAVLLRYFADLPLAEVGTRFNVSENAARMRVERALDKLQVRLARRGVTSSAAALAVSLGQHTTFAAPAGLGVTVSSVALAHSTAVSTGVAVLGYIQLMNTAKFTTIVVGAIAAVALGTAYQQATRASAFEEALATHAKEQAVLMARLEDAEVRASRLARSSGESDSATLPKPKIAADANPSAVSQPLTLEEAIERLLVSNPALPPLFMRQETIRYRSKYGPLYGALGFTPSQIARFEQALADHAQAASDIRVAAFANGIKRDDPAVKKLLDQAGDQRNSQLRVLLGDRDYHEFQDYERTSRGRILADRLASELYYTPHPISAKQADVMARIATDHSAQATGSGMAAWDKMIGEAQTILSSEQLDALRTMKEQAELGMQIHEITGPVAQQFSAASGGPAVAQGSFPVSRK